MGDGLADVGIDKNRLQRAFIEESEEILESLDDALIELENNGGNEAVVNEIFRLMHSLKSESAIVGFNTLSELAHVMEDVFDLVRSGSIELTQEKLEVVLNAVDLIHEMISEISKGGKDSKFSIEDMVNKLRLISGQIVKDKVDIKSISKEKADEINFEKLWEFTDFEIQELIEAKQRGETFYRLTGFVDPESPMKYARAFLVYTNLEQIVNVVKTIPSFDEIDENDEKYSKFVIYLTTDDSEKSIYRATEVDQIQKVELIKLDYDEYIKGKTKNTKKKQPLETKEEDRIFKRIEKTSIRVETKKLDELWRFVGELVVIKSRIIRLLQYVEKEFLKGDENGETLESVIDTFDKITEGIQQAMMQTRMVPIAVIFNKLPRLVRDLSKKLGKKVRFEVEGEETEIDRSIVEVLSEPITHIIRNSLDHGIEFPDERVTNGKAEEGLIKVSAFQEGGNIILQIEDDGRGFDIDYIREKALNRGFISDVNITDDEVLQVVFMPGFSTKEEVTELSGRGVGMDVVATKVKEDLRGEILLNTKKGEGTSITIVLPLTLTILNAVVIRCREYFYAVPVRKTEETLEILNTELLYEDGNTLYNYRGRKIPVIYLHEILGKSGGKGEENYGVVISHGEKLGCLIVDELMEEEDLVIKPIDDVINVNSIFSGISILGDGKIVYILDTSNILKSV